MEEHWGEKIYKARRAKGFSQEYLAELVGVSRQTVSQWENEKFQPGSENIDRLCQVLSLSREAFVGETGAENYGNDQREKYARRQKIYTVLIAVLSSVLAVMAIFTALLGPICLTSNTGDMMDNSYSIPQYAFFVALAVTVIMLVVDIVLIARKLKEKHSKP